MKALLVHWAASRRSVQPPDVQLGVVLGGIVTRGRAPSVAAAMRQGVGVMMRHRHRAYHSIIIVEALQMWPDSAQPTLSQSPS
jgi:hypothetical protein